MCHVYVYTYVFVCMSISHTFSSPCLSQLCRECGLAAQFYNHGVTYCNKSASHPMRALNRDCEASRKIAARFFAELQQLPLGPWAKGAVVGEQSSALVDAQICYVTHI